MGYSVSQAWLLEIMIKAGMTWGSVKKYEVHVKSILGLGSGQQVLNKYHSSFS